MANKMIFQVTGVSTRMKTELKVGNHQLTIDELPNIGALIKGLTPF